MLSSPDAGVSEEGRGVTAREPPAPWGSLVGSSESATSASCTSTSASCTSVSALLATGASIPWPAFFATCDASTSLSFSCRALAAAARACATFSSCAFRCSARRSSIPARVASVDVRGLRRAGSAATSVSVVRRRLSSDSGTISHVGRLRNSLTTSTSRRSMSMARNTGSFMLKSAPPTCEYPAKRAFWDS